MALQLSAQGSTTAVAGLPGTAEAPGPRRGSAGAGAAGPAAPEGKAVPGAMWGVTLRPSHPR